MARIQPWSITGLDETDLETGDTLLDWRQMPSGRDGEPGLRYVHLFERDELAKLALAGGFRVAEQFESDGHGGRLGLYQVWQPV